MINYKKDWTVKDYCDKIFKITITPLIVFIDYFYGCFFLP